MKKSNTHQTLIIHKVLHNALRNNGGEPVASKE